MTLDTRIAPAPIETVTPIRPSEAIRLGCLIAPVQAFEYYEDRDAEGPPTACALGAMFLGYGKPATWDPRHGHPARKPRLMTIGKRGCPVAIDCADIHGTAKGLIPHLNDDHRWSRERIADWLEGLGL